MRSRLWRRGYVLAHLDVQRTFVYVVGHVRLDILPVNTMPKLALLITIFLSVAIGCEASTLVFDFSFVGTTNVPGTVTGEIDGLVDNTSNQAATDIKILSY